MANDGDVRSLLRQQRAARRIEHPYAAYSDAGKLFCTVCQEQVKAEALWDGHLRGAGHRSRVQKREIAPEVQGAAAATASGAGQKRKLDAGDDTGEAGTSEDQQRSKRSRPDMEQSERAIRSPTMAAERQTKPTTPPMQRRTSGTPALGVEMQMPSRPATPIAIRDGSQHSSTSTPNPARSLNMAQEAMQASLAATLAPTSAPTQEAQTVTATAAAVTLDLVDEDEWAKFEAEMINGSKAAVPADAFIAAPMMTAAEIAAKSQEEERERRKALAEARAADEKEDAARQLEDEFGEMEELEARVRRLRERREALRKQCVEVRSVPPTEPAVPTHVPANRNKARGMEMMPPGANVPHGCAWDGEGEEAEDAKDDLDGESEEDSEDGADGEEEDDESVKEVNEWFSFRIGLSAGN